MLYLRCVWQGAQYASAILLYLDKINTLVSNNCGGRFLEKKKND